MNKTNDKFRVFINSAVVMTAVLIENLIFFIINIVIARYLSIEHFGEYTTALGYATFFSTITNIGINQTLIRATNLHPDMERENFSAAFFIKCILGTAVYGIMALSLYFTNYSSELVILTLIMGLFRIGNEFLSSFYSFFDAKESFVLSSVFRIVFSAAFLLITLSVVFFRGGLFDFAYMRLWLVVVFFAVLIAVYWRLISSGTSISNLIAFFKESISFGIFNILGNIYQRMNIIILSVMHGSLYTGFFSNGFIFFTTLFIIPLNISRVLLPYLYKISYDDDSSKFKFAFDIYSKFLTIASFWMMTLAIISAEPVIEVIFGSKYNHSAVILQISAAGIPFIFTIAPTLITALDRQRALTGIYLYGFILSIISNFILIYLYKAEGAAAAAVLTYGYIYAASNYYLIKKRITSTKGTLKVFISQAAISGICFAINTFFMADFYWINSLMAITFIYTILNIIFIINKNDLRILNEIISG